MSSQTVDVTQVWFPLVVSFLSIPDLFRFRAVSRRTFRAVHEHFRRMSNIDFASIRATRFHNDHFSLLTHENVSIRHLNLADCKWVNEETLRQVLRRQAQIVSINLSAAYFITNVTVLELASFCPLIRRLTLAHCHWLGADAFLQLVDRLPHLVEIDLTSCWNIDDHCVRVLFEKRGPTLRRAILAKLYSLTDKSVFEVEKYGIVLSYLDISSCWHITDRGIEKLSRCEELQQIVIAGCSQISLYGFRSLTNNGIRVLNC